MKLFSSAIKRFIFTGALLLVCGAHSCQSPAEKGEIIATAGNRDISWNLIWRSYHTEPKWDRGLTEREALFNQAEFLISQKLFAQEAEKAGLAEVPKLANYLQFIREKEMIKALYRRHVEQQVEISEADLREAYHLSKKHVQFQYFLCEDRDAAERYFQQLQALPFEEIYLQNPAKEEKGISPQYSFGDMAEALEDVVFDMQLNEIAGPLAIEGRWMVLKLTGGSKDVFTAENDFIASREKLKKIIYRREARKISDRYVYELLKDEDIQINPDAFFPLAKQFEAIVTDKESTQPFPLYLSNSELQVAKSNLENEWDRPLVTYGGREMSVYQFLEILFNMPTGMRPQVNFKPQLKKTIAVIVRNQFLLDRAYAEKLDQAPDVIAEAQAQIDNVLARTWLNSFREQQTCTPAEIEAVRNHENFEELKQRFNNNLTDEQLRNIILDKKFFLRRMALADSLRNSYPVHLDNNALMAKLKNPDKIIDHRPVAFSYREKFN